MVTKLDAAQVPDIEKILLSDPGINSSKPSAAAVDINPDDISNKKGGNENWF